MSADASTSSAASVALPRVTFVTGNEGKLVEMRALLAGVADVEAHALDLPELQGTPEEVARAKAREAFRVLGRPCIIEDTSLCAHAMKGELPGVYIKWFLQALGHAGLNKMLDGFGDRSAFAQVIIAMAYTEDDVRLYTGRCYGFIVPPRGDSGFGWDPVFEPAQDSTKPGDAASNPPGGKTFGEMIKAEKNSVSHRMRAVNAFAAALAAQRN
jgi:inosine triphosphate pyrophosphatase